MNGLLFTDISDHLPIFSIWFVENSNFCQDHSIYTFRDKSKENIKTFEKNIINCDWTTISSLNDPTEAYTSFSDNFTQIFNECFPIKTRSKKFKIHKPWISNGLLKSMKTKNRLYKQYIRYPDPTRETKYKKYKNKLIHSIRIAKRLYYDKKLEENKSNIKHTWKLLNDIINRKKNKYKTNTVFTHDTEKYQICWKLQIAFAITLAI